MNSYGLDPALDGEPAARTNRERWLVALGGVLAGLLAFGIGEVTYQVFRPSLARREMGGNKVMMASLETSNAAAVKNGALAFGMLGACMGACMGVAGGLARRSTRAAGLGGLSGALLGSASGAGLSMALLPLFLKAQDDYFEYDLIIAMAMHGLIWGLLGAAAGLAFAVGRGDRRLIGRDLAAGGLGGLLGAIAFDLVGALFFAAAETGDPISLTWPTRLMARLMASLGTAAAIALFQPDPPTEAVGRQSELVPPTPGT